jgi:hypothetical protein
MIVAEVILSAHSSPDDVEVRRSRNLQSMELEATNADITRYRNLQLSQLGPNDLDITRYRNLQEPKLQPNNADIKRYANLQYFQLGLPNYPRPWNSGWDFELGDFETDDIYDQNYTRAPWGSQYWGVRGYTWSQERGGLFPIYYCRFYSDGHAGYLYGWDEGGDWGAVTYIQGDIWNSNPVWNCPKPLPTYLKNITIGIDLWRDDCIGFNATHDRMMYAINVWFQSPHLLNNVTGGIKRLVMDLVFYVDGHQNEVKSFVDSDRYEDGSPNNDSCYHYQTKVYEDQGQNPTPYQTWTKPWKPIGIIETGLMLVQLRMQTRLRHRYRFIN